MRSLRIIILFLACFGIFTFCNKDKAMQVEPCNVLGSSFSQDILPIFETNCSTSGCHDAATNSGGYTWDNHNIISSNIDYILHVINHDPGYPTMPKNLPKLNDTIIQKIQCWADNGALDN